MIASSKAVLPAPLSPTMTFTRRQLLTSRFLKHLKFLILISWIMQCQPRQY